MITALYSPDGPGYLAVTGLAVRDTWVKRRKFARCSAAATTARRYSELPGRAMS